MITKVPLTNGYKGGRLRGDKGGGASLNKGARGGGKSMHPAGATGEISYKFDTPLTACDIIGRL